MVSSKLMIPSLEKINSLNNDCASKIIDSFNYYLYNGKSVPHSQASRGMPIKDFISIIYDWVNDTHDMNFKEILRELHRWMGTRPILECKAFTNDKIPYDKLYINNKSPIKNHLLNFDSHIFNKIHNNILKIFKKYGKSIRKNEYYIINDLVIFVISDSKPPYDSGDEIDKLYNLIIYSRDYNVGYINTHTTKTDNIQSYICVEEVNGSKTIKKCYQANLDKVPTKYMMASVRLVNKTKNSKYDFNHTKIVCEKQFKSEVIHVAESRNYTFCNNDNIYYLGNGYPISYQEFTKFELPRFFTRSVSKEFLGQFISNIDDLFEDSKAIEQLSEKYETSDDPQFYLQPNEYYCCCIDKYNEKCSGCLKIEAYDSHIKEKVFNDGFKGTHVY